MVSLLDIIGPVMVGPSSSHTAGACRLGLLARGLVGGTPQRARVELHGSFARTGEGHGTDKAIVGGLMAFGLMTSAFETRWRSPRRKGCSTPSRRPSSARKKKFTPTARASPSSVAIAGP